jgi:hypothetical protein
MFYFAWVDSGEAFDPTTHAREDEIVFAFDIAHQEGQFPTMSLDIKNPRVGLLALGRYRWAWLSYLDPVTGQLSPLFYGRLTALPSNIFGEVVTLQFVARPVNYLSQKQAIAETLKVLPFYDPVWIDKTKWDDPDTILESYSKAWHIDRVTLQASISDIIFGEDGTQEFKEAESFYDSVSVTFAQSPQNLVTFTGSVTWTQAASGNVKMPDITVSCLNGDQWMSDWPKSGGGMSGGWSAADASITDLAGTGNLTVVTITGNWSNTEKRHRNGDTMSTNYNIVKVYGGDQATTVTTKLAYSQVIGDPAVGRAASVQFEEDWLTLMRWDLLGKLTLRYDMSRGRTENLAFTMSSQIQEIVTSSPDEPANPIQVSLSGADVGTQMPDGTVPIDSVGRSSYFNTDRGVQSLQYALLVARAHLLQSARAVKISFDCEFERALTLSCRQNAMLHDHRLPGGQAIGKITEYHIKCDGDKGTLIGSVQIECAIGGGGSVSVIEGLPEYVDDGYVEVGWQVYDGSTFLLPTFDQTFSTPTTSSMDDGLRVPLTYGQVVEEYKVHGGGDIPKDFTVNTSTSDLSSVSAAEQAAQQGDTSQLVKLQWDDWVKKNPTWLNLVLKPVTGTDFTMDYVSLVGPLMLPKMIDLAAPSSG